MRPFPTLDSSRDILAETRRGLVPVPQGVQVSARIRGDLVHGQVIDAGGFAAATSHMFPVRVFPYKCPPTQSQDEPESVLK